MESDSTAMIQDLLNQCQPIEADDRIRMLLKLLNKEIARARGGLHGEQLGGYRQLMRQAADGLGLGRSLWDEERENTSNAPGAGEDSGRGRHSSGGSCRALVVAGKKGYLRPFKCVSKQAFLPCLTAGLISAVLAAMMCGLLVAR